MFQGDEAASQPAAATAAGKEAAGEQANPEDVQLDDGADAGGGGGGSGGEGLDITIVQKEVPSAVFGSAKEVREHAVGGGGG